MSNSAWKQTRRQWKKTTTHLYYWLLSSSPTAVSKDVKFKGVLMYNVSLYSSLDMIKSWVVFECAPGDGWSTIISF